MAGGSRDGSTDDLEGRRPSWARALYRLSPWGLRRAIERHEQAILEQGEAVRALGELVDRHLRTLDSRLDSVEDAIRALQQELELLRDRRLVAVDHRFDSVEDSLAEVRDMAAGVRDDLVPAVVDRGNLLIDRLARELDEVASLVERMLRAEPLPVPPAEGAEPGLAASLSEIQPRLLEAFRGDEAEIGHRLESLLPVLRDAQPVLDLGSGRGELLALLREAGIEAAGVESDAALAQAARRRGLEVTEGDALEALRGRPDASAGAITAIHLLEHLHPATVLRLLAEARRVLQPGAILLAECPNPRTLRVGAADYWIDPTHIRPLPAETLELLVTASGLEVERLEFLRPYPQDQRLAEAEGSERATLADDVRPLAERVDRLAARLDGLLNGPRDYLLVARRPAAD